MSDVQDAIRAASTTRRRQAASAGWESTHQRVTFYCPVEVLEAIEADAATLADDLAALAWLSPLTLPEREGRQRDRVIGAVVGWLRQRNNWLLVVDNLDDGAKGTLDQLLGRGLHGRVLVTSRVSTSDLLALRLGPMTTDESSNLLLDLTGQSDRRAAAVVANALGGLPLALVQAASYMKTSGRDLGSYSQLLRDRLAEMLTKGVSSDYPLTVAAALKLSLERIERYHDGAAALLHLCASLHPHPLSIKLLLTATARLPDELRGIATDEIKLDHAIAELRRYSLIDREHDSLSIHHLVREIIRDSLNQEGRECWLRVTVELSAGLPTGDLRSLPAEVQRGLGDRLARAALLEPGLVWNADTYPPSALLRPEFAMVPFFGRDEMLKDLSDWAASDARVAVRLYTGAGGMGKTRLLIEFCKRMQAEGWRAGFLNREASGTEWLLPLNAVFDLNGHLLLVIDYAETRQTEVLATCPGRTLERVSRDGERFMRCRDAMKPAVESTTS